MGAFFKYLFLFLLYGVIWFFIYSIPLSKNSNILLALQRELNMNKVEEEKDKPKKAIDREQVIDALTKAFDDSK